METNSLPLADLLRSLRDDTTILVRKEAELAKAEISENLGRTARNAGYIGAGSLIGFAALIMILMGLAKLAAAGFVALEISPILAEVLGYLVIATLVAAVAAAVISKAIQTIKENPLVPNKTLQTLKEDKEWVKDKVTS